MISRLRFITAIILIIFAFSGTSYAEEKIDPRAFLAVAKITGACGILDEMIDFQKKTKMDGGDEFVTRFWLTEAARQGKTVQQVSDDCNSAITSYDTLWKSMETTK